MRPPPRKPGRVTWARKLRYRLEWLGLKWFAAAAPCLPLPWLHRLGDFAAAVYYAVDRRGLRVALANLEAAFGDRYQPAERRRIARRSLQGLARSFLELFWSPRLNPQNFRRYARLVGSPAAKEVLGRHGTICLSIHFGNFEWGSGVFAFEGYPGTELTQRFRNDLLTPIFQRLREHTGHRTITQENSVVRFYKALRKGGRVGLLSDLTLRMDEPGVLVRAFGLWTWTTVMHAALQDRTEAPIIPFISVPQPDGTSEVRLLEPVLYRPGVPWQEIAQECWNRFEPVIAEHPESWLWSYKHWRYRPAVPDRSYPFYANRSPWFDLEWEKSIAPIPEELKIYRVNNPDRGEQVPGERIRNQERPADG